MFLLVPAHPGCPGQIPQSRKTLVCVLCVSCVRIHIAVALLLLLHLQTLWCCVNLSVVVCGHSVPARQLSQEQFTTVVVVDPCV